jgi:coproporphyrinogen III oxidase
VSWFGGGMDLTPYYGFEEDARHFHRTNRDALAPFGAKLYPRFKRWCDEYFLPEAPQRAAWHRGVFFDDFASSASSAASR